MLEHSTPWLISGLMIGITLKNAGLLGNIENALLGRLMAWISIVVYIFTTPLAIFPKTFNNYGINSDNLSAIYLFYVIISVSFIYWSLIKMKKDRNPESKT